MLLSIVSVITLRSFVLLVVALGGGAIGWRLGQRGLSLQQQGQVSGEQVLKIALVLGLGLAIVGVLRLPWNWQPLNFGVMLLGAYSPPVLLHLGVGLWGFLLGLIAWEYRHSLKKLVLYSVLTVLCLGSPLAYTHSLFLPLADHLPPGQVQGDLVLQTTPYTCAAASIATIVRVQGTHPDFTERDAAQLIGTNRTGTTTWAEVRGLQRLGYRVRYERGLTPGDLADRPLPVLLHVKEPVGAGTIAHAVVLLAIDPVAQTLRLANPLYGEQIYTWAELDGYWWGEAIVAEPS